VVEVSIDGEKSPATSNVSYECPPGKLRTKVVKGAGFAN